MSVQQNSTSIPNFALSVANITCFLINNTLLQSPSENTTSVLSDTDMSSGSNCSMSGVIGDEMTGHVITEGGGASDVHPAHVLMGPVYSILSVLGIAGNLTGNVLFNS